MKYKYKKCTIFNKHKQSFSNIQNSNAVICLILFLFLCQLVYKNYNKESKKDLQNNQIRYHNSKK